MEELSVLRCAMCGGVGKLFRNNIMCTTERGGNGCGMCIMQGRKSDEEMADIWNKVQLAITKNELLEATTERTTKTRSL